MASYSTECSNLRFECVLYEVAYYKKSQTKREYIQQLYVQFKQGSGLAYL